MTRTKKSRLQRPLGKVILVSDHSSDPLTAARLIDLMHRLHAA
jgi:hypothetical protein